MHKSSCGGRAVGILGVLLAALLPSVVWASCAPPPELVAAAALQLSAGEVALVKPAPRPGDDDLAELRTAIMEIGAGDADTALSLAADGAALYARDKVRLGGYDYCGQAMELAELGEFRESAQAASKALHVALQTGNTDLLGKAYRDLAITFSYAGRLERAEQFAGLALKYPGLDPVQVVGPATKILGDVRTRQGDYAAAIQLYEQAHAASPPQFANLVQASLANVLILSGDLTRARSTLDALAEPQDARQKAQLQRTRGQLLLAEGNPAEALVLYRRLADAPADGDEDFYRAWALDGISRSQAALGKQAQAADALDQAIAVFDKARSRFRSDEIKMGLFSDLQAVFERAIGMHSTLGQADKAFDISERSRARALLDAVAGRVKLQGASSALDARTLQTMLRPDEVMVAYHALPDRLVAWVLTSDGVREAAFPLALPRHDLERLVHDYRAALILRKPNLPAAGAQIGQLLLAPLGVPAGKRLIIVPHGPLHFLPFQSLRLDGQYLIERNPVSIAPSTSIAARLASSAPMLDPNPLVVGIHVGFPEGIRPLPAAEPEARKVAAHFSNAELLLNEAATKSVFQSKVGSRNLLHLATHGEVDKLEPLRSKIMFAGQDEASSFLTAEEVLGLNLRDASLVVLSACETGLGDVRDNDEVLGFTRSFLGGGAGALVSSLWLVDDSATEKLMTTLYDDLAKGEQVQDAMRDAQRAVLADPATAHPFFWAPFNLIGNWRLTVQK